MNFLFCKIVILFDAVLHLLSKNVTTGNEVRNVKNSEKFFAAKITQFFAVGYFCAVNNDTDGRDSCF